MGALLYTYHTNATPDHPVYTMDEVQKEAEYQSYTVDTYSETGVMLSSVTTEGLKISVTPEGNLSGGERANYDTIVIQAHGRKLQTSGSLVVAYPTSLKNVVKLYLNNHGDKYPLGKSFGHVILSLQPPYIQKYGKLLFIKTYNDTPVAGFVGSVIKPYYTNINDSQVFTIDGQLVFVSRAWFSINDASLFTK